MGATEQSTDADTAAVEELIAAAAERVGNWGRWGEDDVLGTLNFIDDEKRRSAAERVRNGRTFSLAIDFSIKGPQIGAEGRFNPVHTMSITAESSGSPTRAFPHGLGGADDMIMMPMQAATHWDGLGHIFDHGKAWNGREARDVITVDGDVVTGIEKMADEFVSRGVLLDAGRVLGDGELPDGFAITPEHIQEIISSQGPSAEVGRGDIVLLRTGHLSRARREGWGEYAGGPAPGLSFSTLDWIHDTEIAAVAADTWGAEVRPNEFPGALQPLHQVVIPHIGLFLGEMFDFEALAEACASTSTYDCMVVAAPLPVVGGVGAPVSPVAIT